MLKCFPNFFFFLIPKQKCPDQRVSNKELFPTFARTMSPSSKYSKFVIALLEKYKWKDIIIIAGEKPSWVQIVEALEVSIIFLKISKFDAILFFIIELF